MHSSILLKNVNKIYGKMASSTFHSTPLDLTIPVLPRESAGHEL